MSTIHYNALSLVLDIALPRSTRRSRRMEPSGRDAARAADEALSLLGMSRDLPPSPRELRAARSNPAAEKAVMVFRELFGARRQVAVRDTATAIVFALCGHLLPENTHVTLEITPFFSENEPPSRTPWASGDGVALSILEGLRGWGFSVRRTGGQTLLPERSLVATNPTLTAHLDELPGRVRHYRVPSSLSDAPAAETILRESLREAAALDAGRVAAIHRWQADTLQLQSRLTDVSAILKQRLEIERTISARSLAMRTRDSVGESP